MQILNLFPKVEIPCAQPMNESVRSLQRLLVSGPDPAAKASAVTIDGTAMPDIVEIGLTDRFPFVGAPMFRGEFVDDAGHVRLVGRFAPPRGTLWVWGLITVLGLGSHLVEAIGEEARDPGKVGLSLFFFGCMNAWLFGSYWIRRTDKDVLMRIMQAALQ